MNKRFRVPLILITLLIIGVVVWWGVNNIWRSPAYYPQSVNDVPLSAHILTLDEYGEVIDVHERPYIVNIEGASGAVLLYGAEHTRNPDDPQIMDIQKKWDEFRPSIALVEGRLDFLAEGFMDPVAELGEGGWVNKLARDNGVPSYTWELTPEDEIALMLGKYPKERVALFYILRPYVSSLRFGKPDDPEAVLKQNIKKRTQDTWSRRYI